MATVACVAIRLRIATLLDAFSRVGPHAQAREPGVNWCSRSWVTVPLVA